MIDPNGFLYIEPQQDSTPPVIDAITRKAAALWRSCKPGRERYRGVHFCTGCDKATSDNQNHYTPGGQLTHSLLVHYVARHRSECPAVDLESIAALTEEAEPTAEEIQ